MTGREFEMALEQLFTYKGYQVELTPPSNDQGLDLILTPLSTSLAL
ncbi:restriction endonuclease [Paenibacillus sp. Soil787]